jgi:hypothetical protein
MHINSWSKNLNRTHHLENLTIVKIIKSKASSVICRGSLHVYGMLRISHFLHNRLIDDGKVVSNMQRPRSTPYINIYSVFLTISARG